MSEDRDPVITKALRDVRVPDHGPGFWDGLAARLDPAPAMSTTETETDVDDVDELPAVVALPERAARPRRGIQVLAVAAALAAVVGLAITVSSDDRDAQRLRTADAPNVSAPPTTSGPVVTSAPPALASSPTAEMVVLRWLDAVGAGDTKVGVGFLGPRSVAYIEALGANPEGFILEAGEGYGRWADVTDRRTTEIELATVGDTSEAITIVVVSGTWTGEGEDGYKTQAIPATRTGGGSFVVEPFAFDPDTGGRLDIVSPRPGAEAGFDGMAGDGVLEARAPGNGTFHFSIDDELTATLPGTKTAGQSGVSARFDPPGDLRSGTHLFVVAYVDGNTITAFAGTFAVES